MDTSIDIRVQAHVMMRISSYFDSDCDISFRLLIMDLEVNMNPILTLQG